MTFRSPMLAKDYDPAKLVFPVLASPKLDGIRAEVELDDEGRPTLFTRSGKPIRNKFVQAALARDEFLGFDGELIVGNPSAADVFNKTSAVMKIEGEPDFKFYVFDLIGSDDVYGAREMELIKRVNITSHPRVFVLSQKLISNVEQFDALEGEYLAAGYEGMMIRRIDALYKHGRSTTKDGALLKVKRVSHDESVIVGYEERMTNGNEAFTNELGRTKRSSAKDGLIQANTLGAFICRNPKLCATDFNVGTGVLTHEEAKAIWDNRDLHMGRIINFKHLAHGAKDKPRHARFNGFRDADDLS